ncbi:MAG: helix-hairpin-helix domain-containing protein [Actinomycetota bacterium]
MPRIRLTHHCRIPSCHGNRGDVLDVSAADAAKLIERGGAVPYRAERSEPAVAIEPVLESHDSGGDPWPGEETVTPLEAVADFPRDWLDPLVVADVDSLERLRTRVAEGPALTEIDGIGPAGAKAIREFVENMEEDDVQRPETATKPRPETAAKPQPKKPQPKKPQPKGKPHPEK